MDFIQETSLKKRVSILREERIASDILAVLALGQPGD